MFGYCILRSAVQRVISPRSAVAPIPRRARWARIQKEEGGDVCQEAAAKVRSAAELQTFPHRILASQPVLHSRVQMF